MYGVTRCERLASETSSHVAQWTPGYDDKRLELLQACNYGFATNSDWKLLRCEAACNRHYRVRERNGVLGAEICKGAVDGSGCVDTQDAVLPDADHWAIACGPSSPPPTAPPPYPPDKAPLPPPPSPPKPPH